MTAARPIGDTPAEQQIIGVSEALQCALAEARRFAQTDLPVLILGPTGTGKELFARYIHAHSLRQGRFVDVNCGALPREVIESLLFGHRRGAFTGATEATVGLVEHADRGTLFLDELTSLPGEAQAKFLRVLENGRVRRLGELDHRPARFRLVAAAPNTLPDDIAAGRFRDDLAQRIGGVVLQLPPLADRPDDIPPLAEYFAHREGCTLSLGSTALLCGHDWPGNVRQLRFVIERAAVLAEGTVLDARALELALELGRMMVRPAGAEPPEPVGRPSREHLRRVCRDADWQAERIAGALGVSRVTVFRWLRGYGLSLRTERRLARAAVRRPV